MNFLDAWAYSLKLLCQNAAAKLPAGMAGVVLTYLFPTEALQGMAIGAGSLMVCDTVTGVWAAYITRRAIKSARLSRLGSKVIGYGSIVIACAVIPQTIPGFKGGEIFSVGGILGFVIVTEGVSIIENARRMGLPIPSKLADALMGQEGHE